MDSKKKDRKLAELNKLNALKRLADTADGMELIRFVLKESKLDEDPHEAGKNSGQTQHALGKQAVGRALHDALVQSGVKLDSSIFSKRKYKISDLEIEINKLMQGE